jgi:hypothetical protein
VVDLRDDADASALEPFDHPELPQRLAAIEALGHQAADQTLEQTLPPWSWERRVAHVVLEVEVGIVHPHRVVLERDPRQALSVAGEGVEPRLHEATHALDVEPALSVAQRSTVEDQHGGDMHVRRSPLDVEERGIQGAESFVGGHAASRGVVCDGGWGDPTLPLGH